MDKQIEKQEARQAEIDARRNDDVAWRTAVRVEDKNWRESIRAEDREWRLTVREEDKSWRESEKNWRQVVRDDDATFRVQSRAQDVERYARNEIVTKRCTALRAAVASSKLGVSPGKILALAKLYEEWLDGKRE